MRQTVLSFENNRLIYRIQPVDIAGNVESNEVDLLRSEIFALKERVAAYEKSRTTGTSSTCGDNRFNTR